MTTIAHTIKRGEVYHFNHRLGDSIYRKSLKTDSPSRCREYVSDIIGFIKRSRVLGMELEQEEINNFIEMLIGNKLNAVVRVGKAITEPLSPTARSYFDKYYRQTGAARQAQYEYDYTDPMMANQYPRPEYPEYKNWLATQLTTAANRDHLREALSSYNNEQTILFDESDSMIDEFRYPTGTMEWHTNLDNQVSMHAKNMSAAHQKGNDIRLRLELEELKHKFAPLIPNSPPPASQTQIPIETTVSKAPLFEDVLNDLEHYMGKVKQPPDGKTAISNKKADYQDFIPAFKGVHIDQISFESIEDAWRIISNSPKLTHATKYGFKGANKKENRANRWEMMDSGDITSVSTEDLLAFSSLKSKRTLLNDLFKWALRNNHITVNPLDKAELDVKSSRSTIRTQLPISSASSILYHCLANLNNELNWAVLLMAYGGFRNKEVTSLTKNQVITDQDTSVVFINILGGKTSNAKRKVPIHNVILKAGFMEWLDSRPTADLFSFASSNLTNYYYRILRPLFNIPKKNPAGELLNLYSFRHNFISQLGEISDELKYRLVGHSAGITKNYTHIDLIKAQMFVNKVSYNN